MVPRMGTEIEEEVAVAVVVDVASWGIVEAHLKLQSGVEVAEADSAAPNVERKNLSFDSDWQAVVLEFA